ncbi:MULTISPECIES: Uma2 family endonuclease [unclassified Arcicella]|uniref:Uma2 family endonuclease n=1 Tax=unclassified Arcicella TaxID=2644986 RepID=UPI00285FAE3C|nr:MULTISPECIES: Uma2 family endonuclease [unclassified Arcicella]MDR6563075.1 Uma2 family endonuclease [Arcicella sp. BE51]MDR6811774.1 Uma2 family endonuclease [Arcicella sp. BE140]MDR6823299.1 Uma2 family endonuclease [Arcicella sp. BE139]
MSDLIEVSARIYSVEEYFEIENHSEIRHEYEDGILIPMPGETLDANEIAQNFVVALQKTLRKKGFRMFGHDVRTIVRERRIYRYPDVVVSASDTIKDIRHVTEPVLIVEVLSESTQEVDRNKKFRQYTALPSLQYYLMVHQNTALVEFYQRKENSQTFEFNFFDKLADVIQLPALETSITLGDIYEGIQFVTEEENVPQA